MELFLSQLINGISNSATMFIGAIGLVIIFGIMNVVNMAHGEFIMLGAYTTVTLTAMNLPFPVVMLCSFIIVGLIGAFIEKVLIKKLYGKKAETLLVTFALNYILQQLVRMAYGPEDQNMEIPIKGRITAGKITVPYYNLFLIAMAVVILLVTLFIMYKTTFGMQLRSVTQNRQMAQCLGINTAKIDAATFAYGCGLAGLAGVLVSPIMSVNPGMGVSYVLDSFLIVVMGGLNSIIGTFGGAFVIGESVTLMAGYMSETAAKLSVFLVIIILIRFKPEGLFSSKERR